MGKKRQGKTLGYTVLNLSPLGYNYYVVATQESEVYPTYSEAKVERDALRKEFNNEFLVVVAVREIPNQ